MSTYDWTSLREVAHELVPAPTLRFDKEYKRTFYLNKGTISCHPYGDQFIFTFSYVEINVFQSFYTCLSFFNGQKGGDV